MDRIQTAAVLASDLSVDRRRLEAVAGLPSARCRNLRSSNGLAILRRNRKTLDIHSPLTARRAIVTAK